MKEIAWKALHQLLHRNRKLVAAGESQAGGDHGQLGESYWASFGPLVCTSRRRHSLDLRSPPERKLRLLKRRPTAAEAAHGKGESSSVLRDPASPTQTRALSQRQLPTDHDPAVPTREYQSEQPSQLAASGTAGCSSPEGRDAVDRDFFDRLFPISTSKRQVLHVGMHTDSAVRSRLPPRRAWLLAQGPTFDR